ncbi:MAG: 2-oxoacid:acceptor oxidoreductase family protein [Proteobacteria bacterium]|nr:2-oxoacid:acceptor oxidoreductase family protein [Pseudomonadota bacterium]MBU1743185.1 2-oxoacid:acceptor oxidoreductase family protein [Pseudomonadota bacterium]
MKPDPLNVVVTGVGGQGNVLASTILGRTFLRQGYKVTVGETYGLSQRGGPVMSQVRISKRLAAGPLIPAGAGHVVIGLEPLETLRCLPRLGSPETIVLTNDRPVHPINVIAGRETYPDLDRLRSALEELSAKVYWLPATEAGLSLGNPVLANVVILGALLASGAAPLDEEALQAELAEIFPEHKLELNHRAIALGREMI